MSGLYCSVLKSLDLIFHTISSIHLYFEKWTINQKKRQSVSEDVWMPGVLRVNIQHFENRNNPSEKRS